VAASRERVGKIEEPPRFKKIKKKTCRTESHEKKSNLDRELWGGRAPDQRGYLKWGNLKSQFMVLLGGG